MVVNVGKSDITYEDDRAALLAAALILAAMVVSGYYTRSTTYDSNPNRTTLREILSDIQQLHQGLTHLLK